MNKDLQKYLENVIMPKNDLNDAAHNREHVNYVRRRSKKFASNIEGLNLDMVDTIAVYHDVGHSIPIFDTCSKKSCTRPHKS